MQLFGNEETLPVAVADVEIECGSLTALEGWFFGEKRVEVEGIL